MLRHPDSLLLQISIINTDKPFRPGFIHAGRSLYLAGGMLRGLCFNSLKGVAAQGKQTQLSPMQIEKAFFAMVYQEEGRRLITLGGERQEQTTDDVQAYS